MCVYKLFISFLVISIANDSTSTFDVFLHVSILQLYSRYDLNLKKNKFTNSSFVQLVVYC